MEDNKVKMELTQNKILGEVLFNSKEINEKVVELARQITIDYKDKNLEIVHYYFVFCSLKFTKPHLNPSAKKVNLFLREP